MTDRIQSAGLNIAPELYNFAKDEALVHSSLKVDDFFAGVAKIFQEFTPRNKELLAKRDDLQKKIDQWNTDHKGQDVDVQEYKKFLQDIGYIAPEPGDFTITTDKVDDEIATTAGPQLVVPVSNARFAINAANARWGSFYDALYGTDAISEDGGAEIKSSGYNKVRGDKVVDAAKSFLDETLPLEGASHKDATKYFIDGQKLQVETAQGTVGLRNNEALVGYNGSQEEPSSLLFINNGLHIDLIIDRESPIGKTDPAGVKDVVLESAITTIMDLEDSVAAVDAEDKTNGYRNWLGLNIGDLAEEITKNGKTFTRRLNPNRTYSSIKDGSELSLQGRSLLFVRNVGHLMTTDAILDQDGNEVYEGILDAIFTTLCALPGLKAEGLQNSRTGSIYIVKPKMHGPEEVAFAVSVLEAVEKLFGLPANTLKIGIMDEERRTTINLKAAIKEASTRTVFINTGFLDRTGDEIHTSLLAGPFVRKAEMKQQPWLNAYENANVEVGLQTGLSHKAQIGKGMWAMPDLMAGLLEQKIGQPLAGATTAWVPSPTAATLHATHYHKVNVFERQKELLGKNPVDVEALLTLPLAKNAQWSDEEIKQEVDNNCQSILGYVVRWIDQGVGCSKVPDINNVALMEDRATLRISSQLLTNWLYHGIISEDLVVESLKRMAKVVDQQNSKDSAYTAMSDNYDSSIAFQAAKDLILLGAQQPNGYTEPILHQRRKEYKKAQKQS